MKQAYHYSYFVLNKTVISRFHFTPIVNSKKTMALGSSFFEKKYHFGENRPFFKGRS